MGTRNAYLDRVRLAVEHLHNCRATWCATVVVHEVFQRQTVWSGRVEVFSLDGHPKAKRAYAWSHREGKNDEGERFVAVLEIPPVKDAKTAVQASIMADGHKH